MSRENVDRFLECFEVFNRLGEGTETFDQALLNRWLAFFDPDIQFEPKQSVLQGSYVGRDAVIQWAADAAEHYERGYLHFADIRDLEDRVVALGIFHFTGRGSGIEIEVPAAVVAIFEDGLITHLKDYGEHDDALEAVGLSE
jgi:ketosteroid isomerase-like protein